MGNIRVFNINQLFPTEIKIHFRMVYRDRPRRTLVKISRVIMLFAFVLSIQIYAAEPQNNGSYFNNIKMWYHRNISSWQKRYADLWRKYQALLAQQRQMSYYRAQPGLVGKAQGCYQDTPKNGPGGTVHSPYISMEQCRTSCSNNINKNPNTYWECSFNGDIFLTSAGEPKAPWSLSNEDKEALLLGFGDDEIDFEYSGELEGLQIIQDLKKSGSIYLASKLNFADISIQVFSLKIENGVRTVKRCKKKSKKALKNSNEVKVLAAGIKKVDLYKNKYEVYMDLVSANDGVESEELYNKAMKSEVLKSVIQVDASAYDVSCK